MLAQSGHRTSSRPDAAFNSGISLPDQKSACQPLIEPLQDDRRDHPDNPAQKIRHPRNVRILPPSRDFH
jgi:error-prone DNA polymerase